MQFYLDFAETLVGLTEMLTLLTPAHMHFLYTILYAVAQRHEHFKSSLSGSSFQQGSVTPALCLLATTDNYSS